MIKVTGTLNTVYLDDEGYTQQVLESKTFKRYGIRCKLFILKCKIFYDWVEVKEVQNNESKSNS